MLVPDWLLLLLPGLTAQLLSLSSFVKHPVVEVCPGLRVGRAAPPWGLRSTACALLSVIANTLPSICWPCPGRGVTVMTPQDITAPWELLCWWRICSFTYPIALWLFINTFPSPARVLTPLKVRAVSIPLHPPAFSRVSGPRKYLLSVFEKVDLAGSVHNHFTGPATILSTLSLEGPVWPAGEGACR